MFGLWPGLASAYRAAHVFALPSNFETFGIAALEAAVSGCRLVLSDRLAAKKLFENVATFVPPRDEAALASAIQRAMTEDRTAVSDFGHDLTWDKIAERVEADYERLTAG